MLSLGHDYCTGVVSRKVVGWIQNHKTTSVIFSTASNMSRKMHCGVFQLKHTLAKYTRLQNSKHCGLSRDKLSDMNVASEGELV